MDDLFARAVDAGRVPEELRRVEGPIIGFFGNIDGNTVDMDVERAAFAENAVQYEAGLAFINQMLRHIQTALQER